MLVARWVLVVATPAQDCLRSRETFYRKQHSSTSTGIGYSATKDALCNSQLSPNDKARSTLQIHSKIATHVLKIARVAAWALAIAIVFFSLVPPDLRPVTGAGQFLEHFAIFMVTGLAFGVGYGPKYISLALALVVFSGVVEIAQLFAPGRHARLSDFIIDAVAVTAGVAAAPALDFLWNLLGF
jgi:VanZ family protein